VGGGVRGLVQVNHSIALELCHGARSRGPPTGQGCVVSRLHIQLVEVLLCIQRLGSLVS
jgi:hypothetical protein